MRGQPHAPLQLAGAHVFPGGARAGAGGRARRPAAQQRRGAHSPESAGGRGQSDLTWQTRGSAHSLPPESHSTMFLGWTRMRPQMTLKSPIGSLP
ncbi:hypothetical protein GHT09_018820 [Marmota monax]|uniref:Uncharacterized protein n=1 Tax=Marmota monax TaxID=9995 RepID=A0A834UIY2_MARMO|nr:hypothetical protein GHT09_018820 [Marmota monax]